MAHSEIQKNATPRTLGTQIVGPVQNFERLDRRLKIYHLPGS
jgi:hypothetical protein